MNASAVSPGDHFFEADGIRFHYFVGGSGPLVVVQSVGWGMPADYLISGFGPHLEQKNSVVYFEPRGNGESSRPADAETMSAKRMAEDLDHLRNHLGLERFPVLVGASHAAAIALWYAEKYASRVDKLILVGAQIMDSPPNTHMMDWYSKRKDDPAYAAAAATLMGFYGGGSEGIPRTDEQFRAAMDTLLPWYFSDTSKADILRQQFAAGKTQLALYGLQTNVNDMKPENKLPHIEDAGKVQAKTLILWGAEDAMCSQGAAHAIANGIAGSKLVIIPGVGHCMHLEAPERFGVELSKFLDL
ncbi:uncharacterized protein E0L32_007698 [Thyridium curvatum]|uniref:AB hydrolase-1 domain-containing protein n=1 Tax=Thyridium curvatum TaxID=1093900 RepID=A0A507B346_9PEZI|nr:uncharacterized protein E0L32_007698 [Thyridium curvatum]TPX11719.1 hypothetical protein E0L32_007698 [Thyridium curvatum]